MKLFLRELNDLLGARKKRQNAIFVISGVLFGVQNYVHIR